MMKNNITRDYAVKMKGCYNERIVNKLFNESGVDSAPVHDILVDPRIPLHHRVSFLLRACDYPIDFCIESLRESLSEAVGLTEGTNLEDYLEEYKHNSIHLEKSLKFYLVAINNFKKGKKKEKLSIIEAICASVKYLELWAAGRSKITKTFINKLSEKFLD
jgi:hypothetical protein